MTEKEKHDTHKKPEHHKETHDTDSHTVHKKKSQSILSKTQIWIIAAIAICVLLIASVMTNGFGLFEKASSNDEKVEFHLFVMSQCPYCKTVEAAMVPLLEEMGGNIDFKIDYVANENPDGSFSSLHGENEVKGDIAWLCAAKYYPKNYQYMGMIECMNKNPSGIPDNWESCAGESKLDVEKIRSCYDGQEGKDLLSESIKVSDKLSVTGTPTIYIEGTRYSGGRTTSDLKKAICNTFNEAPETCSDIPPPAEVNLIVITDSRCKDQVCSAVEEINTQLKTLFPGLSVKTYDYSTEEGKALFESSGVAAIPAYLFDESVNQGEGYANIGSYIEPAGEYLSLRIGSLFDPSAEICDNNIDDTGNRLVDCNDPECKDQMVCRQDIAQKLDLFVMSKCPYGTQAVDSMKDVLKKFSDIDFSIYYIASENADGSFNSLHGQPEVDENIRQLCVMKYYPKDYQYMDYIWCQDDAYNQNKDLSTTWEGCLTENSMETAKIKECSTGNEGKDLLSENIKLGNGLGISASPTWLANNKYVFSGISSDTVIQSFCNFNTEIEGCN